MRPYFLQKRYLQLTLQASFTRSVKISYAEVIFVCLNNIFEQIKSFQRTIKNFQRTSK